MDQQTKFWQRLIAFPLLLLSFGLLMFYSQVLFSWWQPYGISNLVLQWVAIGFYAICGGFFIWQVTELCKSALSLPTLIRNVFFAALIIFIGIAFFSAIKPAHRIVEGDFLTYHFFLPHQFWIRGNWQAIETLPTEFLLIVPDYALSFLWVAFPLVAGLPQFFLVFFAAFQLYFFFFIRQEKNPALKGFLAIFCLFAFRALIIQVGNTMMDQVNMALFLFLIFAYCLLEWEQSKNGKISIKSAWLFGITLSFYLAHKGFAFVQLGVFVLSAEILLRFFWQRSLWPVLRQLSVSPILIPALFILLPSLLRSYFYTGDPLFPALSGFKQLPCKEEWFTQGRTCGENFTIAKWWHDTVPNSVGWGRSIKTFFTVFFLLPFSEPYFRLHGFFFGRNAGDYPVGLFWLYTWALIAWNLWRDVDKKRPLFLIFFTFVFYCYWFVMSQQGRWMYPLFVVLAIYWAQKVSEYYYGQYKKIATFLILLTLGGFAFNGAKILGSQKSSLFCLGESCFQDRPDLAADYHFSPCTEAPQKVSKRYHLAYFRCPAQPIATFQDR